MELVTCRLQTNTTKASLTQPSKQVPSKPHPVLSAIAMNAQCNKQDPLASSDKTKITNITMLTL